MGLPLPANEPRLLTASFGPLSDLRERFAKVDFRYRGLGVEVQATGSSI